MPPTSITTISSKKKTQMSRKSISKLPKVFSFWFQKESAFQNISSSSLASFIKHLDPLSYWHKHKNVTWLYFAAHFMHLFLHRPSHHQTTPDHIRKPRIRIRCQSARGQLFVSVFLWSPPYSPCPTTISQTTKSTVGQPRRPCPTSQSCVASDRWQTPWLGSTRRRARKTSCESRTKTSCWTWQASSTSPHNRRWCASSETRYWPKPAESRCQCLIGTCFRGDSNSTPLPARESPDLTRPCWAYQDPASQGIRELGAPLEPVATDCCLYESRTTQIPPVKAVTTKKLPWPEESEGEKTTRTEREGENESENNSCCDSYLLLQLSLFHQGGELTISMVIALAIFPLHTIYSRTVVLVDVQFHVKKNAFSVTCEIVEIEGWFWWLKRGL